MKRIVITSDVFRSSEFGLPSVAANRYWLTALFYDSFKQSNCRVEEFSPKSEGGRLDLESYLSSTGLAATMEGWASAVASRIEERNQSIFRDLIDAELVLGWGMPPSMIEFLARSGIPFLDVEIDPVRFAADLFFCVRTNNDKIAIALAQFDVPADCLSADVANVRGYVCRRDPESMRPTEPIGLFVGQSVGDLSIVSDGRLADPVDSIQKIKHLSKDVSLLLVKPHPSDRTLDQLVPILEEVPNAVLCHSNIYRILSDINLTHTISLSSSVITEAELFSVKTTRLISNDRDRSHLLPPTARRWYRVPPSIVAGGWLLDAIGSGSRPSPLTAPKLGQNLPSFNLRRNLGGGWGLDEFYSGAPLTLSFNRVWGRGQQRSGHVEVNGSCSATPLMAH